MGETASEEKRLRCLRWAAFAAFLCFCTSGCQVAKRQRFTSNVNTADPAEASQLVQGFYQIEANAWRWTGREFVVGLASPLHAEQKGAILKLHFFLPDNQIAQLGPMTLRARIDNYELPPETYNKSGAQTYERVLPPALLKTNIVPVVFSFDKASAPTPSDGRELAAVVSRISLNSN